MSNIKKTETIAFIHLVLTLMMFRSAECFARDDLVNHNTSPRGSSASDSSQVWQFVDLVTDSESSCSRTKYQQIIIQDEHNSMSEDERVPPDITLESHDSLSQSEMQVHDDAQDHSDFAAAESQSIVMENTGVTVDRKDDEISALSQMIIELQRKNNTFQDSQEMLKSQLQAVVDEKVRLESELERIIVEKRKAIEEIDRRKAELEEAKSEKLGFVKKIAESEAEITDKKTKLLEKEGELLEKKQEIIKLEENKKLIEKEFKEKIEELEKNIVRSEERLRSTEGMLADQEVKTQEVLQKIEEVNKEKAIAENEIRSLQVDLEAKKQEMQKEISKIRVNSIAEREIKM